MVRGFAGEARPIKGSATTEAQLDVVSLDTLATVFPLFIAKRL